MANSLITPQKIALTAIELWKNSNAFVRSVTQEYVGEFARTGAKAGTSIRIRKPVDFIVQTGPTTTVQDVVESYTTLTVATQKNESFSFSSADLTMVIDDFTRRYIRPAVNNMAGAVAGDMMSVIEGQSSGWAATYDGSGNLLTPTMAAWLNAAANLTLNSVPDSQMLAVTHPSSMANSVATFSNLFNSQQRIGQQYENGVITHALGMDWMNEVTTLVHTTGTLAASGSTYTAGKGWSFGTVAGANQTGSTLTVAALTGTGTALKKGDIIRIAGVNAVNRITKADTGLLQTFVVTADVANGATSIPIYPALTPSNAGVAVPYQTVVSSPANSAVIYCVTAASVQYRKNLVFNPMAVTLAMVDLEGDLAGANVSRQTQDGISMRVASQWIFTTDQNPTRLDVLYGNAVLMPEWITTVADPV
jgi:hypothetical protein